MSRSEPISWATAARFAGRAVAKEPFSISYLRAPMQAEFEALTRQAEELVAADTGLITPGVATAVVVDRPEWANANIASMRRLLGASLTDMKVSTAGSHVTGAQLGFVLGWMSSRVLGQYDPLIDATDTSPQDRLYYVAPNILGLEKRYAFPPAEFRLWVAVHESTHRAQFTGVPWLVDFFKEQVRVLTSVTTVDPSQVTGALRRALQSKKGDSASGDDGGMGLLATAVEPEQREALQRLMGLMALLEGHGEVVMGRAGGDLIPNADRFHRVMHERRNSSQGIAQVLQRLLGMEAKMRQYAQGAAFIRRVEDEGGSQLFNEVWTSPETLPTHKEIADPELWISRMSSRTS